MNCVEIIELITAEIDGELNEEKKTQFWQHINKCLECRTEFELEKTTKSYIRKRIKSVAAPEELKSAVLRKVTYNKSNTIKKYLSNYFLFGNLSLRIITAFGAAVVLFVLIFIPGKVRKAHQSPFDDNIIHQIYNNYDFVLAGELLPQVKSEDPQNIKTFFIQKADFNVLLPPMKQCLLVGGVFSKYTHEGIAQLLYRHDDNIIYICETKLQDMLDSDGLQIPGGILNTLLRAGRYSENEISNCSLTMWIQDSTVCCAIADLPKEELLTFLTESE